jgi:hypothetical protein
MPKLVEMFAAAVLVVMMLVAVSMNFGPVVLMDFGPPSGV